MGTPHPSDQGPFYRLEYSPRWNRIFGDSFQAFNNCHFSAFHHIVSFIIEALIFPTSEDNYLLHLHCSRVERTQLIGFLLSSFSVHR